MSERSAVTRETQAPRETGLVPAVDVIEDSTGITLYADLPGVSKDGLNVHVEADTLTVEGALSVSVPEAMEASHAEVALPRYRRVFTLSKELDTEKVSAELNQGVLKLRIPKVEQAKPRRIEINVA
ncbi:MAG TPA: Hsp20/alpha crystallin family protein [Burkholderiales bacterium]|nr:Hsp20/alpha crystallin family protein [Betaproteobacteria bacterium]HQR52686.1 Hsp20/alpha crystallin family protein [Burkholderiales bacterium]